jgi:plastocyanin
MSVRLFRRLIGTGIAVALLNGLGGSALGVSVVGGGTSWSPVPVDVATQGMVNWSWSGFHNVTQTDSDGGPPTTGGFTSGSPVNDGIYGRAFDDEGVIFYRCDVHFGLGMRGTIRVGTRPAITTSAGTVVYQATSPPIVVDAGLDVADPDVAGVSSAVVSITSGHVAGSDTLTFTANNGISGAFNSGTGELSLSGAATATQYQQVLRSVAFSTTNATAVGTRGVSFAASDPVGAGSSADRVVNVVPRLTGGPPPRSLTNPQKPSGEPARRS